VGEGRIRDTGRDERVTVADAADRLGITKEAVRKRISRRTLLSDKDADGTVWVYIPPSGTSSGTASETIGRDELVELLRAQLEDLRTDRDAWRDQARRSDYMASTAMDRTRELENRLRELEAPQEASESPETVEEAPDRAESQTDTGGAQEGTERRPFDTSPPTTTPSQGAHGLFAPVDSLPQEHYVLWLLLVFVWSFFINPLGDLINASTPLRYAAFGSVPALFGLWIGIKDRSLTLWRNVIPIGALSGIVSWFGLTVFNVLFDLAALRGTWKFGLLVTIFVTLFVFLVPFLFYVSSVLVGNAWQRHRINRTSGFTPQSLSPRAAWTPRSQALLGFAGTILASLIGLIGPLLVAMLSKGG